MQLDQAVSSLEAGNSSEWATLTSDPTTLRGFLHSVVATKVPSVPEVAEQLKSVLEPHATVAAEIIPSNLGIVDPAVSRKRRQRVLAEQTRITTFDLLKEVPEGYAKLVVLFSIPENCTWERVEYIIGQYFLEPFKVLSIWFNACCVHYHNGLKNGLGASYLDQFVEQLPLPWKLHPDWYTVLYFQLSSCDTEEINDNTLEVLYLIAFLVIAGVVSLDDAWKLVCPASSAFAEIESNFSGSNVSTKNALSMAMPLADDDDDEDEERYMESDEEMDVDANADEHRADSPTYSTIEYERTVDLALAFIGELFNVLADFPNPVIQKTALKFIHKNRRTACSSVYVSRGLSKLIPQAINEADFWDIYVSPVSHAIVEPAWSVLCGMCTDDIDRFRKYLLPSVDLHPSNQPLLFSLNSNERYTLYTELQSVVAVENEFVKQRFTKADRDAKDVLKRLTKKDAEKLAVPQLLAVIAECPMPSLIVLVNQVESYNIGRLVAQNSTGPSEDGNDEYLRTQFTPLAMDILPLILMQQLTAAGRQTQQDDGMYESRWFRLLAQFAGDIAEAHPKFDFVVLIKFVLHQFALGDFSQVVVVDVLIRRLAGIPPLSNLSVVQLQGLGSAQLVSEIVAAAISEQWYPQTERLIVSLADNAQLLLVALSYAYNQLLNENTDAKVLALRRDFVGSLSLAYAESLGAETEANVDLSQLISWPFAAAYARQKHPVDIANLQSAKPYNVFWQLSLYDVCYDNEMYVKLAPALATKGINAGSVDRASLSHRLRAKSIQQALSTHKIFDLSVEDLRELVVPRIFLSPTDALFVSRFFMVLVQHCEIPLNHVVNSVFERGVLLSMLNCATPLETESFAICVSDLLQHIMLHHASFDIKPLHTVVTEVLLEASHAEAAYMPLANSFSFMQRTLLVFPAFAEHGDQLLRRCEVLATTTEGDLATAVRSLQPQLARRQSMWTTEGNYSDEAQKAVADNNARLLTRLAATIGGPTAVTAVEAKNTGRQDSRPSLRQERQDLRTDMRQDTRVDNRQDTRSDTRQDTRLATRQDTRLDSRQDTRPDTRLDVRADTRLDTRQDTRLDARLDTRQDTRLDTRQDTRQDTRLDARQDARADRQEIRQENRLDSRQDHRSQERRVNRQEARQDSRQDSRLDTRERRDDRTEVRRRRRRNDRRRG